MKYLFIVQGEGRGHLTQAMTLEKLLIRHGHEVVGMIVGRSRGRELPDFFMKSVIAPVSLFETVTFVPSAKNKRPNGLRTFAYNILLWIRFMPSLRMLRKRIAATEADCAVNFYELLGTLAYMSSGRKRGARKIPMVAVGHQFLFLHKDFDLPVPGHEALNFFSWMIARGASTVLALSFRPMEDDIKNRIKVVPPLLRREVLDTEASDGDYILGYMLNAGFADEVMSWHINHPEVPLRFFWDDRSRGPVYEVDDTLTFYYLDDKEFLRQMAACHAYASTAGFESICEAMYLGKPLLLVPSHLEQECNAYDAGQSGAAVVSKEFNMDILIDFMAEGRVPDNSFPDWARSAEDVFTRELGGSL